MAVGAASAQSTTPVDLDMVARIRQEAFQHSQVMATLQELTEDVGPRLTASPNMDKANAWAREKLSGWGMANVHDEAFDKFGRGWDYSHSRVEMVSPHAVPLYAIPKAWTPGTNGPVEGDAMIVSIKSKDDLEQYKGKLKGKIAFVSDAREYKPGTEADWQRLDADGLAKLHEFEVPADRNGDAGDRMKRFRDRMELVPLVNKFLVDEGVLAAVSISSRDNGIIGVSGGGSRTAGDPVGVPDVAMLAEQYNQIMRDLKAGKTVRLRIDVDSHFTTDDDRAGYNTIAEIPGSGPKASEIVMLGAHMDSWHSGTGASDNGAGVAVMMEAMRILKAVGAHPNRTIRVALWSGEEQGLIGSAEYVAKHFAAYPPPKDPEQAKLPSFFRQDRGELQFKPGYDKLSVYFNLDNGSGKIRGVYAQQNMAAMPIFESWIKPFNDVGATDVVSGDTGSTDHVSFDRVGLPGFQFVQDDLDYFSNVHHTNLDTLDHASAEDLKQAAAIVASLAYDAAMAPQRFPRKPMSKN
ncbi:MAG TPA: M20/M25/M40 family metallo-hydrolase [Luteimonas sp.]|nr:M20/M25/M40 family metallo-hydrolase [Luteimonas sp.]